MTLIIDSGFNYDPDASAYIDAVEAADQADTPGIGAMETATRYAIDDFVLGCKQDGIWNAIKASCILAGAKTLEGSFIDLKSRTKLLDNNGPFADGTYVGSNYTTGDYNRKTGLMGNGTTKYLNSNRANNADPQNSSHIAAYVSSQATGQIIVGGDNLSTGRNYIDDTGTLARFDCRTFSSVSVTRRINANTLAGVSRSSSESYNYRLNGSTVPQLATSGLPDGVNTFIYARSNGGVIQNLSFCRLAFYSIGESLNLGLLDARVTALINAFGVAIP